MSNTDGSDLVVDIEKLALNNNFYDWFITTNKLIDAVNPLNIYDITARKGLTESRANGHVILDVDSGKGIKTFPDDGTGKVTLDFESLTEKASPSNDDLFVIEQPATGNSNNVYKIFATNMLPPILTGNHIFTGTITVAALNVNDNVIRLQYGDATTENDSGLILDTTTSSKVKFTYDNAIQAWFSNKNLGLNSGYSFVTNSGERRANFKFGTYGSNQFDTGLELMMGQNSTQGDDKSFIIEGRNSSKSFEFIYKDYTNTDTETTLFYSQVETVNPVTSTFKVMDKIQIGNVSGSVNFKNDTSLTTLGRSAYEANRIPISNSDGILDNKWTNRYVTTQHSGIAVGNIVKLYDDTNNQATVVKSALTSSSSEEEAYSLGIVERLSGGKAYIVTHGQFDGLSGLLPGSVYYLTTGSPGSPNYTTTKPTSGIVKPVFIATSTTGGIFFPMSAQGLSFGRATVSAGAGGTASGSAPVADAPTDTLNFVAGAGINLVADPASTSIQISAATAGNQPTYSSFATDSGTAAAFQPSETLLITGAGGGIEVIADNKVNTNGDKLTIKGKYFRSISWIGDNSTNDIPGSKTATYDDNLQIYAGTGIGIRQYLGAGGGILIEATGQSVATVANGSITISKLAAFSPNSVLIGNSSGTPTLQVTTANSILSANSSGVISWDTPTTILQDKFAKTGFDTGYPTAKQNNYGITPTRNFGIIRIPRNALTIGTTQDYEIPAFRYTTTNSINGALIGLQEGDGIELAVNNTVADAISGIPSIKITNKYGSAFSKVYIADTGETIESNGTATVKYSNYFLDSNNMSATSWLRFRDTVAADGTIGSATSDLPGKQTGSTIVFTDGIITSTNGAIITFVNNPSLTSNLNNGIFANFRKPGTTTLWNATETEGKYFTISVYVATSSGTQSFKIGYFHGRKAGFSNTAGVTYSPDFTATTTPQRFTFTIKAQPSTTVQPGTTEIQPNINISQPFGTINGGSIVVWGAQVEEGRTANPLIQTTTTAVSVTRTETQSHGTLTFDTTSSPIVLDSDTNSDTIYFNIAADGITNTYLANMADNTVKVGTGSTNADNSPQDLTINANSVLGRVGSGDLKSVSASELATMIGTNSFTSVETDSGTVTPSETNAIKLKGGSGIVVTESTNHEIIITNTGGSGGTGSLSLIGDWNGTGTTSSASSREKLLFADGDLEYVVSTPDTLTAIVSSNIRWSGLTPTTNGGAGLLYGKGGTSSNTDKASITTSFQPIGNNTFNSGVTKDCIPYIDSSNDTLSYVKRASTGQTTAIDRVVGFDSSGNLVATDKFVSGLTFDSSKITGLSASVASGQITISVPTDGIVKFPNLSSTNGFYFGESNNLGLVMDDNGTNGQSDFIFATADLNSSYSSSFTSGTYITSINLGGAGLSTSSGGTQTVRPTSTTIKTRYFGDNGGWTNISGTSLPRICMPEAGFMIGEGPTSSTSSLSTGMYLRTDTTNNALTFTNYNFTASSTRTIAKDRSTRIGLEVLNVPANGTPATNYTGLSANTAYITHSIVPSGSTTVDQFAVPVSSKKSYKYFIHAEDGSGDFFTTELVVQVKAGASGISTSNIIQYGSTTTNSTSLPTVTFSLNTTGSSLTVTLVSSSSSLSYKVLKYEI